MDDEQRYMWQTQIKPISIDKYGLRRVSETYSDISQYLPTFICAGGMGWNSSNGTYRLTKTIRVLQPDGYKYYQVPVYASDGYYLPVLKPLVIQLPEVEQLKVELKPKSKPQKKWNYTRIYEDGKIAGIRKWQDGGPSYITTLVDGSWQTALDLGFVDLKGRDLDWKDWLNGWVNSGYLHTDSKPEDFMKPGDIYFVSNGATPFRHDNTKSSKSGYVEEHINFGDTEQQRKLAADDLTGLLNKTLYDRHSFLKKNGGSINYLDLFK